MPAYGVPKTAVGDRVFSSDKKAGGNAPLRLTRCDFPKLETMLTHACLFYCECMNCKTLLSPQLDDCCVFCSFASVRYLSIQRRFTTM